MRGWNTVHSIFRDIPAERKESVMASPCGGCPPGCDKCVFSATGEDSTAAQEVVVPAKEYGCIRGFGDIVKRNGVLGQMRVHLFHPVSAEGAAFLVSSRNPLAPALV
jgi:hypothetical protein